MPARRIAIFASGSGTNAEAVMSYFSTRDTGSVVLVLSNKPDAFVLERARRFGVDTMVFGREAFYQGKVVPERLRQCGAEFIVLAGFLWLIPPELVAEYRGRILNIHPALLPKYGGKGMYGKHVHEAVLAAGDPESGITIHLVNEVYDEGSIIFQARCEVKPDDTPDTLARRIHELEHRHYPEVIERMILKS